jgi:Zn-dependent alcohol dehydrogenase
MGAKRIIAMSRHEARQKLAREFGATDIVTERGEDARHTNFPPPRCRGIHVIMKHGSERR